MDRTDDTRPIRPPRLVELERIAEERMLTPYEMQEMRDIGASVRARLDQIRAEIDEIEDETER